MSERKWTPEEHSEFRKGLKRMGFKRQPADADDVVHGTETWSINLDEERRKAKRDAGDAS